MIVYIVYENDDSIDDAAVYINLNSARAEIESRGYRQKYEASGMEEHGMSFIHEKRKYEGTDLDWWHDRELADAWIIEREVL